MPMYYKPYESKAMNWVEDNASKIGYTFLGVMVLGIHLAFTCVPCSYESDQAEGLRVVLRDCKEGRLDKELYNCDTVKSMLDKELSK